MGTPNTIAEYFQHRITSLDEATRLIIVLDPNSHLGLNNEIVDGEGRQWTVYPYCENDLKFRLLYHQRPESPNFRHIIWVTLPRFSERTNIDLSYIGDILRMADEPKVIDCSLTGVLGSLAADQKWMADTLSQYEETIAVRLGDFVRAYRQLRLHFSRIRTLSIHHIRSLILKCLKPELEIPDLMFSETSASDLILHYMRLAFSEAWQASDLEILRKLALESTSLDVRELATIIDTELHQLALYMYIREIFDRHSVPNSQIQVRGLQLVDVDDDALEPDLPKIMKGLQADKWLWNRLTSLAEHELSMKDVIRVLQALPFNTIADCINGLEQEKSPAIVYGLAVKICNLGQEPRSMVTLLLDASLKRAIDSQICRISTMETQYTVLATTMLEIMRELAGIETVLSRPFQEAQDFDAIIDWHISTRNYRLELAFSKVRHLVKSIGDKELSETLDGYMKNLDERIKIRLNEADLNLANLLESSWPKYLASNRLSCNVVRSIIRKFGRVAKKPRIWVLIFDGMRWDTWAEIIKPILQNEFEITDERSYICALPSVTNIARVSLIAGKNPGQWIDSANRRTSDHNVLAAKLFELDERHWSEKLRIVTSAETDRKQVELDLERKDYNILIYNLSDDWIHTYKDSVWDLNKVIEQKFKTGILPDLKSRIEENDYVLLTSDHGFIELDEKKAMLVRLTREQEELKEDDPRSPITYRYLRDIDNAQGLKVTYGDGRAFCLAKGKSWFQRIRGRPTRYSHGGISLCETIVPGVTLERIVTPIIAIQFMDLPAILEVSEDEPQNIEIRIKNEGNKPGSFVLSIEATTGEKQTYEQNIGPKSEVSATFRFTPKYRSKRKRDRITCNLSYRDVNNATVELPRKVMSVTVRPRKDKVEFDFSGLEKLDESSES